MFDGADDGDPGLNGAAMPRRGRRWGERLLRVSLAAAALCASCALAQAQSGAPSQCGPVSVGTGAVSVTFPAAGKTGPTRPTLYLTIANPSASATLWVNPFPGGTAAANTAGSYPVLPSGSVTWPGQSGFPPPATISVIASAGSTPMTCGYQ